MCTITQQRKTHRALRGFLTCSLGALANTFENKETNRLNQTKINAIHEATLVVKALLWLCLLSIY